MTDIRGVSTSFSIHPINSDSICSIDSRFPKNSHTYIIFVISFSAVVGGPAKNREELRRENAAADADLLKNQEQIVGNSDKYGAKKNVQSQGRNLRIRMCL